MPELHPGLMLIVVGLVVAVLPRRLGAPATLVAAAAALAMVWGLDDDARVTYDFYGYDLVLLAVDGLARPFAMVFSALGVLASLYGWTLMNRVERAAGLATIGAGLGVVLAGDLLTLFLFWEFKVITVVVLIAARGRTPSSAAAQRYLFVHLVGGLVLLGGVLWHSTRTGSFELTGLELQGPVWLILIGVLVGAAAVPLHAWLPDAYPSASITATVILSAVTTKSAVYVLARAMPGFDILIWVGVVMAVVGVTYALMEDDLRRLLSYHIVSQVGFMVTAVGVGTPSAINGATAHATAHVLYKGLLLMAAGAVVFATGRQRASALGGLATALPWVLALYMVGALSISGMVGFSGFPAKELAVYSVGADGATVASWLLKFASVGTFLSVALKLPALTWFGSVQRSAPLRRVPTPMYAAMALAAVANVAMGVRPAVLFDLLPNDETFQPYTAAKITESLALLTATAVGFMVLRARLTTKAVTNLDVDVLYRDIPATIRPRLASLTATRPTDSLVPRLFNLPRRALDVVVPKGVVAPGWLIGGSVAAGLVLVLSLVVIAS
jgi:multicomponent Na+:H+ antiporter subunit D